MKTQNLLLIGAGLAAAYFVFGKGSNQAVPIPPAEPNTMPTTFSPNNFVPVTQPATQLNLTTGITPHTINIGAAGYGNCQCRDGSLCVGKGNCACCDKKGGAVAPHTFILPMVRQNFSAKQSVVSGISRCMG